jgi:anti-sigma factor RsiW
MYDCRKTREFLELYLDSELEAVPTQHVAAHLGRCASCRRELEILRSQNELLTRSVKSVEYDTRSLRASIEAATTGRRRFRLPGRVLPRLPAWSIVSASVVIVAVAALLFLPGLIGVTVADPLYRAAADNHRACVADPAAPDWVRSRPAIDGLAASYLGGKRQAPATIGGYRLTHARVCRLHGEDFLHLVYETREGREASLFIGRWRHDGLPAGERSITFDGQTVQIAHTSDLHVTSTRISDSLLIATAEEDSEAVTVLLGARAHIRA